MADTFTWEDVENHVRTAVSELRDELTARFGAQSAPGSVPAGAPASPYDHQPGSQAEQEAANAVSVPSEAEAGGE